MLKDKRYNEVKTLFYKHPNIPNSIRGGVYDFTLLMEAAFDQQQDSFEFLSMKPTDVSVVSVIDANVLHFIVWFNDDDVAIELMNYLDISQLNENVINKQTNTNKQTPLHYAASRNRHRSIKWLLEQGADPLIKDDNGLLPGEHDNCDEETKNLIRGYKKW